MNHRHTSADADGQALTRAVSRRSAIGYFAVSATLAATFALAAGLGSYETVAVVGGTLWVFLLSMIVSMPLVTSWFERREERRNTKGARPLGGETR